MKHKFLVIALTLILLLTFAAPAFAQGPVGDQVIFGRNLTLKAEETIQGNVIVFGGNVNLPASAKIDGDLVVFGGNAGIDGTVTGDIGMIGGNITLGETAVVQGDIGLVGGRSNVTEGAKVNGRIENLTEFGRDYGDYYDDDEWHGVAPPVPPVFDGADFNTPGWSHRFFDFVTDIVSAIALLVVLGLISWLVATFMPEQIDSVSNTVIESAPISFGVGLLTAVVAAVMLIPSLLLIITICLALIPIAGYVLLGVAGLFGWIVIGQIVGYRLLVATGQYAPNFAFSTMVGVIVLTLMANMPVLGSIPCLGFIFNLIGFLVLVLAGLTGLGAVILTRFGTRPYPAPFSYTPRGSSASPPVEPWRASEPDSYTSRTEAELKAKIKAALAEADQPGEKETKTSTKSEKEEAPDIPEPDKPEETPDPDSDPKA